MTGATTGAGPHRHRATGTSAATGTTGGSACRRPTMTAITTGMTATTEMTVTETIVTGTTATMIATTGKIDTTRTATTETESTIGQDITSRAIGATSGHRRRRRTILATKTGKGTATRHLRLTSANHEHHGAHQAPDLPEDTEQLRQESGITMLIVKNKSSSFNHFCDVILIIPCSYIFCPDRF